MQQRVSPGFTTMRRLEIQIEDEARRSEAIVTYRLHPHRIISERSMHQLHRHHKVTLICSTLAIRIPWV